MTKIEIKSDGKTAEVNIEGYDTLDGDSQVKYLCDSMYALMHSVYEKAGYSAYVNLVTAMQVADVRVMSEIEGEGVDDQII